MEKGIFWERFFVWMIIGIFTFGISITFASLTFTGTAITGDSSSTIDVGTSTLSLQTANNGPITAGSGLFMIGGTLKLSAATGTQCLHETSGTVSGTGSDCGSGSGVGNSSSGDLLFNSSGTLSGMTLNGSHNVTYNTVGAPADYGYLKLILPLDHNGVGQFQPVFSLVNASNTNSPSQFSLDTDGELHIDQYHNGAAVSHLRLDPNSDLALWSGASTSTTGAAFSTNFDGHTCIGAICIGANGIFTVPSTLLSLNNNGTVDYYKGVALGSCTTCNGIATILYHNDTSNFASDLSNYTIYTPTSTGYGSAGLYRLSGYLVSSSTQAGTVMNVTLGYTDDVGANTQAVASSSFASRGAKVPFDFTFYSAASQAIQISFVHASGSQPTYHIHMSLEEL